MKKTVQNESVERKKKKVLGEPNVLTDGEYQEMEMNVRVELIKELIPLETICGGMGSVSIICIICYVFS